jgi:cation diffusion facilitator CzcD-associated flavoprotein CzcO
MRKVKMDISSLSLSTEELGFDPHALRKKYEQERDKRIRPDSTEQYRSVTGDFSHLTTDPFSGPAETREPLTDEVEVIIVGGGHCGLLAAVRLQEAGIENFRIIEGAADFGGAWYWNRYPGIRCDIESYIYLPLIEETGYMPSERYTSGNEIFENSRRIGDKYNLYSRTCFQTHVDESRWDEAEQKWIVKTDRNDVMKARFVIMAMGPLNRPKLPGIPGIENFKGHMFHTSRWDYNYTGGSSDSDYPEMNKLKDKKVGLVGTGCTGIQCAPRLAEHAQHLSVFQRTPSAVSARNNRPTDTEWAKSLTPGWQSRRSDNFDSLLQGLPTSEDLVNDGWTEDAQILAPLSAGKTLEGASFEDLLNISELIDFELMTGTRDRVDSIVEDQETASKLKAWYRLWCKRPSFSDNYLPIFNQPNVSLVDTNGLGVERFTENGAVVNGVEHELDCVIFASGYEVGTDYCKRGGIQIFGRDGVSLSEYWSDGMKTLYGYMSNGFPNCFHMGVFLQNAAVGNFTSIYYRQAQQISSIVSELKNNDKHIIEPSKEAEAAWVQEVTGRNMAYQGFLKQCTPGYYNAEGKPESGGGLANDQFVGGVSEFNAIVDKWREDGMPGVDIS